MPYKNTLYFLLAYLLLATPLASSTSRPPLPITLEKACSPKAQSRGLSGRTSLPENTGMIFIFPRGEYRTFWMKGCSIDLDIAFLNQERVIEEIVTLRAYPELANKNDPATCQFFHERAHRSRCPATYVVEMEGGWFAKHKVKCGDRILWSKESSDGEVIFQEAASIKKSETTIDSIYPKGPHDAKEEEEPDTDKHRESLE